MTTQRYLVEESDTLKVPASDRPRREQPAREQHDRWREREAWEQANRERDARRQMGEWGFQ